MISYDLFQSMLYIKYRIATVPEKMQRGNRQPLEKTGKTCDAVTGSINQKTNLS